MISGANAQAYGPAGGAPGSPTGGAWGGAPWGPGSGWTAPPWAGFCGYGPPWTWHRLPRPFAIAATVLGFIVWWPVGLALLAYNIGSGSMGCRSYRRRGGTGADTPPWGASQGNGRWAGWRSWCGGERAAPTSGNRAFDEYRTETLRRLEQEQQDFAAFLERLRFAKDKSEFDQFMAERRQPPTPAPEAPDVA